MKKGNTYLEPGYVYAPYVPMTEPWQLKRIPALFHKSPQPGDLIKFCWQDLDEQHKEKTGLCLTPWTDDTPGTCLYETGFVVEFIKDDSKGYRNIARLEVISAATK